MTCAVCNKEMGQPAYPCPWCGQTPAAAPTGSPRLDDFREEMALEKAKRDLEGGAARKRRLRSHAIAGAITFFLLELLLGLPMSLRPAALLVNAILSVLFGAPLGFTISWYAAGRIKGALISMAGFFILIAVVGFLTMDPDTKVGEVLGGALLRCPAGALPGWIIGLHVEVDD